MQAGHSGLCDMVVIGISFSKEHQECVEDSRK